MSPAAMVNPAGPLVVVGKRWGLPTGQVGRLDRPAASTAATMGVPVVLVMPSPEACELWDDAAEVVEIGGGGDAGPAWRFRVTVPGAAPVTVVMTGLDTRRQAGPWFGLTGGETCTALRMLDTLLGVPWGHSVGRTAEHLILSTHPRRKGGRVLDRAPVMPEPIRPARVEQPWHQWQRPWTEYEATAAYVHTYDANAAYLGVWQTVELGFGRPEHFTTPRGCAQRVHQPGAWRVELDGWDNGGLPPIAPGITRDGEPGAGWVTTPTLGRLAEWAEAHGGLPVPVPAEGWVWPERSRFLRAAGERLRDARLVALRAEREATAAVTAAHDEREVHAAASRVAAAGVVREAVRDLYAVTVGRFSSGATAGGWARPDWGNTIRAAYRVGLHRKIAGWGAAPFAIATDALAFATDDPDPAAYAAAIGLRLGDGLGQFRHQGTARREAVADCLGAGPRGVARIFTTAAQR